MKSRYFHCRIHTNELNSINKDLFISKYLRAYKGQYFPGLIELSLGQFCRYIRHTARAVQLCTNQFREADFLLIKH